MQGLRNIEAAVDEAIGAIDILFSSARRTPSGPQHELQRRLTQLGDCKSLTIEASSLLQSVVDGHGAGQIGGFDEIVRAIDEARKKIESAQKCLSRALGPSVSESLCDGG